MPEENKIKRFTAADIEKYHKGLLPAEERHELEKAALDDPFLADALEGYATQSVNISNDIDELRKKLSERIADKKVIPISSKQHSPFTLWRVAAILLLIAGAGYLTYQFSSHKPSKIAENNALKQQENKRADSATQSPAKINDTGTEKKEIISAEIKNNKPAVNTGVAQSGRSSSGTPTVTMEYHNEQQTTAPAKALSGNKDLLSESAGAGNEKTTKPVNDSTIAKDNEQETAAGISENRKQPAQEFRFKKATPDRAGLFKIDGQAEPLSGWNNYKTYLANNLRIPGSVIGKNSHKEVVVSFKIDDNGNPADLKIERSSCSECEPEVIRVIKEGTKWKSSNKNDRTSIIFSF